MFPNIPEENSLPFSRWFINAANREYQLPNLFIDPIRDALNNGQEMSLPDIGYFRIQLFRLYDSSSWIRRVTSTFLSRRMRTAIKNFLLTVKA